ncbi:MerR family transcriptional regulator [Cryptosporangium phraense]|uniref:MerR family transcriptional regulator n=1 Tax=Cryptosporangium phraense TaxID=2593070 RepID=A0A545AYV1_9ACTN|nr:MerR family transcriptional regulator [Cryptosporangium phraense]TQS46501.1 MerR family transcriptional regulator [Cryptosporangium phraense]
MESYTRAEAVRRSGLSADTIRYYERVGLVPPVQRTAAGRRRYTDVDLRWLSLVHCLREAGMPIAEIDHFSRLMRTDATDTDARLDVLRVHERRVEAQIERLHDHLNQIRAKIHTYESGTAWTDD